jgi:methylaspartate mutase epsilon subunit
MSLTWPPPAGLARGMDLPSIAESVQYAHELGKPTAAAVLAEARRIGRIAVQPRCGVGDHDAMMTLLRDLEAGASPDLLTITIDAHTRLLQFDHALRALNLDPGNLNGYPLVTHGWARGRELNEAIGVPLEIRHGSPDARPLFRVSLAAGITSFEGGGISYNLPYSKNVPLTDSLASWREVDALVGEVARAGLIIDRELFGTLTAVLVPPSISLAIGVIEALCASREGVRCISVSYPQGGNLAQDVAALRAIPVLACRYLSPAVEVYPVLHEFMGVFPRDRAHAEELIFYGALTARLGGATKLITKTHQESLGIPDTQANVEGLRLARVANSTLLDFVEIDEDRVTEEMEWILQEVAEIAEPILSATDPYTAIVDAFTTGTLDIPFSASRYAQSEVIPGRDRDGAIRYLAFGRLPLSRRSVRRHTKQVERDAGAADVIAALTDDINYFPLLFGEVVSHSTDSQEG